MGNSLKIEASAIMRIGPSKFTNSNFYVNGKFVYENKTENLQVVMENDEAFQIFAVSELLDVKDVEERVHISIVRELKKYHDKVKSDEKSLSQKGETLKELIQGMSNLITSVSYNKQDKVLLKPSFSGLLIQDNRGCVVNLGTCKAYAIRNGTMKQLSTDWEKTERLLQLGIITDEQVKELSSRFGIPTKKDINEIIKTEEFTIKNGDVFLLCTDTLVDTIGIENISNMISPDEDAGTVAGKLAKENSKHTLDKDVTLIIVKIVDKLGRVQSTPSTRSNLKKYKYRASRRRKSNIFCMGNINKQTSKKYASLFAFCLIIIMLIVGTVKLISGISKKRKSPGDQDLINNGDSVMMPEGDITETENDDNETGEEDGNLGDVEEEIDPDDEIQNPIIELPSEYRVKKGDTLYGISNMFYDDPGNYKLIMEKNNIDDPTKIQIGQTLIIPAVDSQ